MNSSRAALRTLLACCMFVGLSAQVHADTFVPHIALPPQARATEFGLVTHIVDGDTFDLVLEDGTEARVRPLCWDAPEVFFGPPECMGEAATERLGELILGEIVVLTMDVRNDNGDGRLLRHVYLVDGTWVGAEMVRGGFARTKEYPPDTRLCWLLWQYEAEGKAAGAGGWTGCDVWPDW